jgi:3-hydroxyisobutyrate dehydrogenase-like beta-hydroxyacid dehydrogenase
LPPLTGEPAATGEPVTGEDVERRAIELAASNPAPGDARNAAAEQLLVLAGGDREVLSDARNRLAARLRSNAGDHGATGALTLLNKALVLLGWTDKYDWKIRWNAGLFIRP